MLNVTSLCTGVDTDRPASCCCCCCAQSIGSLLPPRWQVTVTAKGRQRELSLLLAVVRACLSSYIRGAAMRQGEKKVKPRAVAVPAAAAPGAPAGCLKRVCRGLWFLFDIVRVRVSGGTVKGWKFTNDKNAGEIRYYRIAFGICLCRGCCHEVSNQRHRHLHFLITTQHDDDVCVMHLSGFGPPPPLSQHCRF